MLLLLLLLLLRSDNGMLKRSLLKRAQLGLIIIFNFEARHLFCYCYLH